MKFLNEISDAIKGSDQIKGILLIFQAWALSLTGLNLRAISETAELWTPILKNLSFTAAIISTLYGVYKLSKK